MSKATDLIAAERERQVTTEGYTPEHDKGHALELVQAASRYVRDAEFLQRGGFVTPGKPDVEDIHFGMQRDWPWLSMDYKPDPDPVVTLVKSAALIAATIDSLLAQRKALDHE